MNTLLKIGKSLSEEPAVHSAGYLYGILSVIFALLIVCALLPSQHYVERFIIPLMLLFNHLAFQFRWPRPTTIALRAFAICWLVFGAIWLL
jgi:hypothetical protein